MKVPLFFPSIAIARHPVRTLGPRCVRPKSYRLHPALADTNFCNTPHFRDYYFSIVKPIDCLKSVTMKTSARDMLSRRIIPLVLASLLLLYAVGFASSPKESKRVLILYSQEKGHPAHDLTDQGIRAAFRSNTRFDVQLYAEYLDTGRFAGPGHALAVADYLRRKYAAADVDAIIAVYPQAVDFLLAQKHALFPGVPVIACEVLPAFAERLEHSPAHRFVTGVVLGNNAALVLDDALRLRPGTKRVALVSGTTANDVLADGVIRDGLKAYAGKLELIDLAKLPMREILERVGRLSPDTVVLFSSLFKDGSRSELCAP